MKHAFLIITHQYTHVLETLLRMIDDERNDIYVHIDKRVRHSYEDRIVKLVKKSDLYFVRRHKVYWGHVSQIKAELELFQAAYDNRSYKAELELFQAAYDNRSYSYYHLLSGSDLPIRSQDEMHCFFDRYQGREYISFSEDEMPERMMYKWLFPRHLRGLCPSSKWVYRKINKLQGVFTKCFIGFQKSIGYKNPAFPVYKKGPNWVSLTGNAVVVLLGYKKRAIRGFRHANCPDEHYKHTILYCVKNGLLPYPAKELDSMDNYKLEFYDYLRFITWGRGSLDLTIKDYSEIIASDDMFCRKVVDDELADKMSERIGANSVDK